MTTETERVEAAEFPADLDDAEALLNDTIFEVQSIQDQLGNRNKTDETGRRFTDIEYWEWRHRAAGALRHRQDELRALRLHVRELRIARGAVRAAASRRGIDLVNDLVRAYREGRSDDVLTVLAALSDSWNLPEPTP